MLSRANNTVNMKIVNIPTVFNTILYSQTDFMISGLALIRFYFLVSHFVNVLFWPRALDLAGYLSVFECMLNIFLW